MTHPGTGQNTVRHVFGVKDGAQIPFDRDPWWDEAACRGKDIGLFFPPKRGGDAYQIARAICQQCPVMLDCRAACDADERGKPRDYLHGMFGGETPNERFRRRKAAA